MVLIGMNNNNESIHLWILEQDRQKNRELTLEQHKARHSSSDELPHIPGHLLRGSQEMKQKVNNQSSNSEIENLYNLVKEKEALEEESKRLDKEKEHLINQAKLLLEKVIQDLKKKNSEKQEEVDELKTRFCNLENQTHEDID